jgi:hypothetical protein
VELHIEVLPRCDLLFVLFTAFPAVQTREVSLGQDLKKKFKVLLIAHNIPKSIPGLINSTITSAIMCEVVGGSPI